MSCATPPSPTPPTLRQLLEQLAAVDRVAADVFRPGVELIEGQVAQARAELAAEESALAQVPADGSRPSWTAWEVQFSKVNSQRTQVRLLGVDEGSKRAMLERALFIARQGQAIGRVFCSDCAGSGDGEPLDGGTCLVPSSCDTCNGTGYVNARLAGTAPAAASAYAITR